MPQFYAEILRNPGPHDNSFRLLASNDPSPSTISWAKDIGVTATSDGDILTFSGSSPGLGVTWFPGSTSSTTYPYLTVRAKAAGGGTLAIAVFNSGATMNLSITLAPTWTTFTVPLTTGRTISSILFGNQSIAGNILLHYAYLCSTTPLQISQKDVISGSVTRSSLGTDHAELRLNNYRGKFVSGSSSASAFSFGDHLHIYLGQGPEPFHVYGGEMEQQEPVQPSDEIFVTSRGFGLALQQALINNQPTSAPIYTNGTPLSIINDFIDNHVNNANKNGVGIASNYRISRSYVQSVGNNIPLYISQFKTVWDSMRELMDLSVAQGFPGVFFVDPAENLHVVPLGAQGAANWGTDPIPATYGTTLATGSNLVTYLFPRDVKSLRNRVHYFAAVQYPEVPDSWTENNASSWTAQAANGDYSGQTTATFSNENSIVAQGNYSVKCILNSSPTPGYSKAMLYPSAKNLAINVNTLGSVNSPPIFDCYLRWNQGSNSLVTVAGKSPYVFFGTDTNNTTMTDYFKYSLIADGNTAPFTSMLGQQGINNVLDNFWYHVMIPIGSHAGVVWNPTPVFNTVAPAVYTGPGIWQLASVGSPSWSNINYIGMFWEDGGGFSFSAPFYFDGFRILGGRHYLAYDNRSSPPRYPVMREIHFYDPVTKGDSAIQNYAKAELKRLWNPIVRGTATTPLLANIYPEQQVQITTPSANYSNTFLRATSIIHRFSPQGMLTEFQLSDDFTNSQPLDLWKLSNALLQMGENAIFSREVYDLKTAIGDPTFTPILIPVT